MKSNLDSVRRAANDTLRATHEADDLALQANYMQTREVFAQAEAAAELARQCADIAQETAIKDIENLTRVYVADGIRLSEWEWVDFADRPCADRVWI